MPAITSAGILSPPGDFVIDANKDNVLDERVPQSGQGVFS
tara:strand:- start:29340 stop:29459 length:120 start_codon:yes stop_codon:yes gene_type:complete